MGGYAINGYINNNKDLSFTASTYADQNNQFERLFQYEWISRNDARKP